MVPPGGSITNFDARGCSLGAMDGVFHLFATSERDAHATILECFRFREDTQIHRLARRTERKGFVDAFIRDGVALLGSEDDRRCRGSKQLDRRDRQPKNGAQVKLELVRELADQCYHPGVVRTRRKLREDRLITPDEEFNAENSEATERLDHLAPLETSRLERLEGDPCRHPALTKVAGLLAVTNRRAEENAVLRGNGEKGDLAVKLDEFLDDHARAVAAHVFDGIVICR